MEPTDCGLGIADFRLRISCRSGFSVPSVITAFRTLGSAEQDYRFSTTENTDRHEIRNRRVGIHPARGWIRRIYIPTFRLIPGFNVTR